MAASKIEIVGCGAVAEAIGGRHDQNCIQKNQGGLLVTVERDVEQAGMGV